MKPFIVIAEDEQAVSELLRYNLEAEGYETAIANDGDEAMLLIDERIPDLMLLDWMLPQASGSMPNAYRAIRSNRAARTASDRTSTMCWVPGSVAISPGSLTVPR